MFYALLKMILPSPGLVMDDTLGYGVLIERLQNFLARGRWDIVESELAKRSRAELSLLVLHMGTTKQENGSILQSWYQACPHSFYATLIYAHYFIEYAWDARGSGLGSSVTEEMGMLFFQRLEEANALLEEAKHINPNHPEPYALSIVIEKARAFHGSRLIEDLNRTDKLHIVGQRAIINGLSQRWGGAKGEGLAYAKSLSKGAPKGSLLHGLIADAHIEIWMDFMEDLLGAKNYFTHKNVKHELLMAYEKAFPQKKFTKDIDTILVLNAFAFCFYLAKLEPQAREILTFLKGKSELYPWEYADSSVLAFLDVNYAYTAIHKELKVDFKGF